MAIVLLPHCRLVCMTRLETFQVENLSQYIHDCWTIYPFSPCTQETFIQATALSDKTAVLYCRWFHFRLTGVQNEHLVVKLVNAGKSSFPEAWPGYRACASYDLKEWFRVNTTWDDKTGVIEMQHVSNHVSLTILLLLPDRVSSAHSDCNYWLNLHRRICCVCILSGTLHSRNVYSGHLGSPCKSSICAF